MQLLLLGDENTSSQARRQPYKPEFERAQSILLIPDTAAYFESLHHLECAVSQRPPASYERSRTVITNVHVICIGKDIRAHA